MDRWISVGDGLGLPPDVIGFRIDTNSDDAAETEEIRVFAATM
jgi:hypothetical protein